MNNLLLNVLIIFSLIFVESNSNRTTIFEEFQKYTDHCPELGKSALFDPSLRYLKECSEFPTIDLTDDNTDSFLCVGILEAEYKLCNILKNISFDLPKDTDSLNKKILEYSDMQPKLVCEYLSNINNSAEKITNLYMRQLNPILKNNSLCTKLCSGYLSNTKSFCALIAYIYKVVDEINRREIENNKSVTNIKPKEEIKSVDNIKKQDTIKKNDDNKPPVEIKPSLTAQGHSLNDLLNIPKALTIQINKAEGTVKPPQLKPEVISVSTQSQSTNPKVVSVATNPEHTKVVSDTDTRKESNEAKSQTAQQKVDGDSIKVKENDPPADIYDTDKKIVTKLLIPPKNDDPIKITPEPKEEIKKVEEPTEAEAETIKDLYNSEVIQTGAIDTNDKDDYFDKNVESKYNNDATSDDKEDYNAAVVKPQTEVSTNFFKKNGKIYPPPQYNEVDDSNFFTYFMFISALFIGGYIAYHNKQKIMALVLEGRRDRNSRRRPNTASYRKLNSNLEEAVTSKSGGSATNVIY